MMPNPISSPMGIALLVAFAIWLIGFAMFGRFIAPRWKVLGKLVFYLAVSAILTVWVGSWAYLWIVLHPLLGIAGHIWWCQKHEINWLTCQPRERYLALRPWASQDGFSEGKENE